MSTLSPVSAPGQSVDIPPVETGAIPQAQAPHMLKNDSQNDSLRSEETFASTEMSSPGQKDTESELIQTAPAEPVAKSEETGPDAKPGPSEKTESEVRCVTRDTEHEYRDIAAKLYQEEFVLIVPEEYTQFLAALDAESTAIRQHYMDMFKWSSNLLELTRMLCRKLYLKGESQEIDRILLAFTKLYLKQHPDNAFCTAEFEQIYIVLYLLILLNTALHNSEVRKTLRISQGEYIRNTLATFLQHSARAPLVRHKVRIERELHLYYEDLARAELYLKRAPALPRTRRANRLSVLETIMSACLEDLRASHDGGRAGDSCGGNSGSSGANLGPKDGLAVSELDEALARQRSGVSYGASHWSAAEEARSARGSFSARRAAPPARFGFTRALHSDAAGARAPMGTLRNYRSFDLLGGPPLSRRPSHGLLADQYSMLTVDVPDTFSANLDTGSVVNASPADFDVADYQDRFDLTLELNGAPYLKEGLLKLRIIHNDMADFLSTSELAVLHLAPLQASSARGGLFSFLNRSRAPDTPHHVGTGPGSGLFSNKLAEFFVVVSKGELRLYSFDPKVVKKHQQRIKTSQSLEPEIGEMGDGEMGDGNWLKNAANVGNYNLCATVAAREEKCADRPARNAPPRFYWSLTFPKVNKSPPKKFIFEAGTVEVAAEFIDTCNFWASKISAVPTLEESMSSIEYGWNNLTRLARLGDGFKRTKEISKYEQIPKGVYLSNYVVNDASDDHAHEGLLKQFMQTLRYYNNLKILYNKFSKTKSEFLKGFRKYSRSSNYKLVLANYDARSAEYKDELNKYKSYLDMLGHGLKLRFDLEEQDLISFWAAELQQSEPPLEEAQIRDEIVRRWELRLADESSLSKAVRIELAKRDSTANAGAAEVADPLSEAQTPLVKSPKTFSFTSIKEVEVSPITQLLSVDSKNPGDVELVPVKADLVASFSTNTITEEEEPEEESETMPNTIA